MKKLKLRLQSINNSYSSFSKKHPKLSRVVPVIAVAIIGTSVVLLARAATFSISIEPETGTKTGVTAVSDTTASGSSAVQFGLGSTGGLPTGVTLRQIDGGPNYYSKWPGTLSDDPSYFPFAVFNVNALSSAVAAYKDKGLNVITNFFDSNGEIGNLDTAKANGMKVIMSPQGQLGTNYIDDAAFKTKYQGTLVGWQYQEEGEGNGCDHISISYLKAVCTNNTSDGKISGQSWINMSNIVRTKDPTRPLFQGWTYGFALDYYPGGSLSQLAQSSDSMYYDVYSKLDTRHITNYDGESNIWGYYTTIMSARKNANYSQPIWPTIGPSAVDTDSGMNPTKYEFTAADTKAAVWQSLIGGARGINYFKHCICSNIGKFTSDIFTDSRYASQTTAVKEVNAAITRLATVINSPFADGFYTIVSGNVNSMAKYKSGDGFYIFAASHTASNQDVTFSVKAGSSVTVVDEGRSIPITNGTFKDNFAGETAYHIYKVNP